MGGRGACLLDLGSVGLIDSLDHIVKAWSRWLVGRCQSSPRAQRTGHGSTRAQLQLVYFALTEACAKHVKGRDLLDHTDLSGVSLVL